MAASTTTKEKKMELLIVTLALSILAVFGQLRDVVGGGYGAGQA